MTVHFGKNISDEISHQILTKEEMKIYKRTGKLPERKKTKCGKQIKSVIESTGIELFNKSIIAYEPVWAIGTGQTATPMQAEEVHSSIRSIIEEYDSNIATSVPILYGGSVNGANSKELFTMGNINGGLIGGASLNEEEFLEIYQQTESLINE